MARCVFTKPDGEQCIAHAQRGAIYCRAHRQAATTSRINRRTLLALIEANQGPTGLDLSGKDLEGIDLSTDVLREEIQQLGISLSEPPCWLWSPTGGINLAGAVLKGVNLNHSYLWRGNYARVNFQGAQLISSDLGRAILAEADLTDANLTSAILHDVVLNGAVLSATNLAHTDLSGVDFRSVAVFEEVFLHEAKLDGTRISKEQGVGNIGEENQGDYLRAKDVYLALKINFIGAGRYDDAAWAYVQERKMERSAHHPLRAIRFFGAVENVQQTRSFSLSRFTFLFRHTSRWLMDWLDGIMLGYGQRPLLIMLWAIVILVTWPLFYYWSGGVVSIDVHKSLNLIDYFQYSIAAFTTMGLPDMVAVSNCAKFLTNLEALLGITLLALLMWALGNKVSRSL